MPTFTMAPPPLDYADIFTSHQRDINHRDSSMSQHKFAPIVPPAVPAATQTRAFAVSESTANNNNVK